MLRFSLIPILWVVGMLILPLPLPVNAVEPDPNAGHEWHVAMSGDDSHPGTSPEPFRTIGSAALAAQPGDVIMVHEGIYRERVNPPRGGTSDNRRIVYQAAPGERVEIRGSEVITGWEKVQGDVWKVEIPNAFFGDYNPYAEEIRGDWFNPKGRKHHTGAVLVEGHWLMEAATLAELTDPKIGAPLWFGEVDATTTRLWAVFPGIDPNGGQVEIFVRPTVFYPDSPGRDFITVRGFILSHAATQWAPPTAEQVGLLGVHWSRGWIIENNTVSHSRCVGISLGKYGDEWDNTSADTAEGYVKTIERAHERGWSEETIGGHIVRNNTIRHCEQAGIVGSLGAIFSRITDNTLHDIHQQKLFSGAEMAGIKIHAAIDVEIARNHIHRTVRGIWLDWMAQGARVTGNLMHHNDSEDLFMEVNHGPFLIDTNLLLSPRSLLDMSQGGAYVHNLFGGQLLLRPELTRETPWHPAHSTRVAGLKNIAGGDDRFLNNLFVGRNGLSDYDSAAAPVQMAGNVFLDGAVPSKHEAGALRPGGSARLELQQTESEVRLRLAPDPAWAWGEQRELVTSDLLGRARVPDLPYLNPDRSPVRLDRDFFGNGRNPENPTPGPFEWTAWGEQTLPVSDPVGADAP